MPLHGTRGIFDALVFGDASDGDAVISAGTFLSRDMYYRNLTVQKGATVFTNGFRLKVREVLTIEGDADDIAVISNNGLNARGSVGSTAEVSSSVPSGTLGALPGTLGAGGRGGAGMYNGGRGIGNLQHPIASGSVQLVPAVDIPTMLSHSFGGAGGTGGDSASGSVEYSNYYRFRGDLGASGTVDPSRGGVHSFFTVVTAGSMGWAGFRSDSGSFTTGTFHIMNGGGGGGAGAAYNSGPVGVRPRSGWGGGGGGVIFVAARELFLYGRIEARGGMGGNTFDRAGGGGGGGGGVIFLAYEALTTRYPIGQHVVVDGGLGGIGQPVYRDMTASLPGTTGSYVLYEV